MTIFRFLFYLPACVVLLLFCGVGCAREAPPPGDDSPRIVSLAPSLTEIICAIGAENCLIGRTSACDEPAAKIKKIPIVGDFGVPNLEYLLTLRPSLVLDTDLADISISQAMAKAGLKRQQIPCATIDDVPPAILKVGQLTGHFTTADALATKIKTSLAELKEATRQRATDGYEPQKVFIEIWDEPLTTAGKNSFISDMVTLAGGQNIGDDIVNREYFVVSAEWVLARNPDVIIRLCMADTPAVASTVNRSTEEPAHWQRVAARTGWNGIAAVRNKRVYADLDNNAIMRPGPRILEGIAELRRCIMADVNGMGQVSP